MLKFPLLNKYHRKLTFHDKPYLLKFPNPGLYSISLKPIYSLGQPTRSMDEEDFERFFNLGDSIKAKNHIGQKGLGTKTFF